MRTVGIIGGLGPQTSAEFYLNVVFGCCRQNGKRRPPVLLWSVPLELSIEEDLLTKSTGAERYIPYLTDAAKRLEDGGADFLVMPCNTLHIFLGDIRRAVKIPVLSIVEETAKFLAGRGVGKVGILATSALLGQKLYEWELAKCGIAQVAPDAFDQAKIGKMINNLVQNRHANRDREELLSIVGKFGAAGVEDAILACTDLQLLIPQHPKTRISDTMNILSDATVLEILR